MGDFQLSASFLQGGHRPPRTGLLGDFHLTLAQGRTSWGADLDLRIGAGRN